MRRTAVLALTVTMLAGGAGAAYADGNDLVVVVASSAGLTIAGGATAAPATLPAAQIGDTVGVTVGGGLMTVSDLRGVGVTSGWHVTAQYATPAGSVLSTLSTTLGKTVTDLGGANVKVKAAAATTGTGVTPTYLGTATTLGSTAVTVASAAVGSASNQLTTFTPSYQVTAPATAAAAQVFAGTVVYTIADAPTTLG